MQPIKQFDNTGLQRWLLLACVLYFAFIVYGSLVPLHFVSQPFTQALQQFQHIPFLQLGIRSRADWVANILLFIPFSFLLCAVSFKPDAVKANALRAALIWLICLALAVSIEFTQLYFPQRTVSLNDMIAESIGGLLGIGLYFFRGTQLKQFLVSLSVIRGQAPVVAYLLMLYVAAFVLYNLLPLDLTLSPVELYKKWREGRIVLLPFSAYHGSVIEMGYAVLSDILLWCPIAGLLFLQHYRGVQLYSRVLSLALLLEACQLFVYSRVTDISDVLSALLATWLSVRALSLWQRKSDESSTSSPASRWPWFIWPGAVLLYSALLLVVFWYPFNFNFDWSFIHQSIQKAQDKVLLESLYFGTEYRAITALLQKITLFFPLGVILALFWRTRIIRWQQQAITILGGSYVIGLALLCEAMQLALPGKTVDITDAILQMCGAGIGFILTRYFAARLNATDAIQPALTAPNASVVPVAKEALPNTAKHSRFLLCGHIALSLMAMLILSRLSALPYNVRELLNDSMLAVPGMCLVLYLLVLPAALSFKHFARFIMFVPLLCLLQSIIIFWLLYFSAPTESLHDILGAPITKLPQALELMLRFIGFFSLIQFNCLAALQFVGSKHKITAGILWLGTNIVVALIWYVAVIKLAATDNIVELLADGGGILALTALTLWLILLFTGAAVLAQQCYWRKAGYWTLVLVMLIIATPASWWLVQAATESIIVKYQQVFSAIQFLLSTDRAHYLEPTQLALRYHVVFVALLGIFCWFYLAAILFNQRQRAVSQPYNTATFRYAK